MNRAELAIENRGDEVARELAEAREKTETAIARAHLLIQERAATEIELARVRVELERLRDIVQRRDEVDRRLDADANQAQPGDARSDL